MQNRSHLLRFPHRPAILRSSVPLAALLLAAFVAGCNEKAAPAAGSAGAPGGAGAPPAARLAAIVLAPASASGSVSTTGTVLAEQEVELRAEITGRVTSIGFREGEPVAAGQILLELEGAELKAQADRAEANLDLARTRVERMRRDFKAQAVSRNELDQSEAAFKVAKAEAALTRAQWEKTRIRAPFAGKAGLREVELGSVVQPGTRLTTLQNVSSLRVEFSVPERLASTIRTGYKVRFTAAGTPDTLDAVVYAVESRLDPETRLLRVRARTSGAAAAGKVLPGSFARVELPSGGDKSLRVPTQAVVQSARGAQVWRVKDGKAELVLFTPGIRDASTVEVASGLSRGDTILVAGLLQLRPGTPVVPQLEPAAEH